MQLREKDIAILDVARDAVIALLNADERVGGEDSINTARQLLQVAFERGELPPQAELARLRYRLPVAVAATVSSDL